MNFSTSCEVFYFLLILLVPVTIFSIDAFDKLKNNKNKTDFGKGDDITMLMLFILLLVLAVVYFFRCFH